MNRYNFAVIFDMDGVLIDSNPYHKIALQQFCTKYGFNLNDEELKNRIYGRTNKEWIRNLFGHDITEEELRKYALEKEELYRKLYAKDISPVKGLLIFLTSLRSKGIKRAIGTSAPRGNVDFTLKSIDASHFFDIILDESDVEKGKPDPEIYIKCARAVGYAPANCIVIEDSISGLSAAKASGAKVIGISTTHSKEEMTDADLVITDFDEITPESLQKLFFNE
jgi:beta-phosphoglucomutase